MRPSETNVDHDTPIRVLVAGGTGLIGRHLLRLLVDDPAIGEVRAIVRRASELPAGVTAIEVDFEHLEAHPAAFEVDQVYCALGTTIKVAGSQEAFRRVDFEYPLEIARQARRAGARHLLLVSALGADAESRIFYNRVKGELEDAVGTLDYRSVTIARPSLLLGDRGTRRTGEELAKLFAGYLPARWRGVHAEAVAESLIQAGLTGRPGVQIIENRALLR